MMATLDINRKPARFYKKDWIPFVKHHDYATPSQRKLLDRLEAVRPDMAPLKLYGRSPRGSLGTGGLYRPDGVYCVTWAWVRREVREGEAERERERQQEIEGAIGAGI